MQLTPLQSMGSGFSAACLGPVCTGPFDVIKASVRMITIKHISPLLKPWLSRKAWPSPEIDCLMHIDGVVQDELPLLLLSLTQHM